MQQHDSRVGTYEHIGLVQQDLARVVRCLLDRLLVHDHSKLVTPEVEVFDRIAPRLAEVEYGSDDYRATLGTMKTGIRHHYDHNPHHPEHYANGIRGMSLLDLIEMLCDWRAAAKRHPTDQGLSNSILMNQERFGYSDELRDILLNTAMVLENGDAEVRS